MTENMLDPPSMHTGAPYKSMLKDIIKNQIQHLIDQLSDAGEESALLTACLTEDHHGNALVGSHLGRTFLQVRVEQQVAFKEFCLQTIQNDEATASPAAMATPRRSAKRPLHANGLDDTPEVKTEDTGTQPPETKRTRTNHLRTCVQEVQDSPHTPIKSEANGSETDSPKGQHKCTMCSYVSKFKANVSRHERSIHGLNMEGASTPSVQYACTLCQYKSLYRSNLMRHEKTVHKMESSTMEIESRKVAIGPDQGYNSYQQELESQTEDSQGSEISFTEAAETSAMPSHICSYCQLVCLTIQNLREHIEAMHLGSDRFTCENCGKKFDNLTTLQDHMTSAHGARRHFERCLCGKTFQYRASLIRHEKRCTFGKNVPDEECGTGTGQKEDSMQGTGVQNSMQETGAQDAVADVQGTDAQDAVVGDVGTGSEHTNFGTSQGDNNASSSQLGLMEKQEIKQEIKQESSLEQNESSGTGATYTDNVHSVDPVEMDTQQPYHGNVTEDGNRDADCEDSMNNGKGSIPDRFQLAESQYNTV